MTIAEIKSYMKSQGITQIELSEKSGLPLQTLRKVFSGKTANPRIDTMQAIENALGLTNKEPPSQPELNEHEKQLLRAFNALIPPMQDYVIEMLEKLVEQPQNVRKSNVGA